MIPSTISGHAHACPASMPERRARSLSAVNDNQNAPAPIPTVPVTAVRNATRPPTSSPPPGRGVFTGPAPAPEAAPDHQPAPGPAPPLCDLVWVRPGSRWCG